MAKIALSHSRLSDYNQCPRKFQLKYIEKAFPQEDGSPHLVRGSNVHKALETYIIKKKCKEENIPPSSLNEVESTKPLIDNLFNIYGDVDPEAQVAVNDRWQKVEWFGKDAYYRCIIDLIAKNESDALIGDFKTGKIRDYDGWGGQLHLTATVILNVFPSLEKITMAYLYVDHKKTYQEVFTRADLPKLTAHFEEEHDKVNADTEFKPTVNEFCKWCPATKAQCPFSRKM
jgi:CRISPR/Cas system-associated exonuclease Cas4 (RecB family)